MTKNRLILLSTGLTALLMGPTLLASGVARNKYFSVIVHSNDLFARTIVDTAEEFRESFCREWGVSEENLQPTAISVHKEDSGGPNGFTIAGGDKGRYNNIFIRCDDPQKSFCYLKHELCHVFLSSKFVGRLPSWLEEGIASKYDSLELLKVRLRFVKTNQLFPLKQLIMCDSELERNTRFYTTSVEFVEFLLTIGSKESLCLYGQDLNSEKHYSLREKELQKSFDAWVRHKYNF